MPRLYRVFAALSVLICPSAQQAHTPRGSNVVRGAALDFGGDYDDDEGEEVAAPPASPVQRAPAPRQAPGPPNRREAAPPARRNARDALVRRPRRPAGAGAPTRPQLSIREDPPAGTNAAGAAPSALPLAARLRLLSAQAAAPQPLRRIDVADGGEGSDDVDEAEEDDQGAGGADPAAPPAHATTTPGARGAYAARLPRAEAAAPGGAAPAPRRAPQYVSFLLPFALLLVRHSR